jgi:hypothetical protein
MTIPRASLANSSVNDASTKSMSSPALHTDPTHISLPWVQRQRSAPHAPVDLRVQVVAACAPHGGPPRPT